MGADDRFGSSGDSDLVKNITNLNGRFEIGFLELS